MRLSELLAKPIYTLLRKHLHPDYQSFNTDIQTCINQIITNFAEIPEEKWLLPDEELSTILLTEGEVEEIEEQAKIGVAPNDKLAYDSNFSWLCDQKLKTKTAKAQLLNIAPIIAALKEELRIGNILTAKLTDKCRKLEVEKQEDFRTYQLAMRVTVDSAVADAVKQEREWIVSIIHDAWEVRLDPNKAHEFYVKYGDSPGRVVDIIEQALKE